MALARMIIVDPESERACSGNCRHLDRLALEAFVGDGLSVTTISRVPERTHAGEPDLVVLRTPTRQPLADALRSLRDVWRSTPILAAICNISDNIAELSESLRRSLDDFFCCPVQRLDIVTRLRRLMPEQRASHSERAAIVNGLRLDTLVGENREFLRAVSRIGKVTDSNATVLIGGETGVGKELFARAIHYNSPRRSRPFIPINCSAVPDALFENELFGHQKGAFTDAATSTQGLLAEAEGGTVFLDEIDSLSNASQAKLLRFLQDREYRPLGSGKTLVADVRVIAATNAELRLMVSARQFREDLFHRLNILCLHVPPLRERVTDIPLLANHFLAQYATAYERGEIRFSLAAMRKMLSYSWPGNVRELEGLLHRAVVFSSSDVLDASDIELPDAAAGSAAAALRGGKDLVMIEFERGYLTNLLAEHRGNVSRAAHAAGRDRRTFQRLLRKHGIERYSFTNLS